MNRHNISTMAALSTAAFVALTGFCALATEELAPATATPPITVSRAQRAEPFDRDVIHGDAQVVHVLITANTGEVDLGMAARQKATDPSVRSFAETMVTDHEKSNDRVRGLAQEKKITPEANPVSKSLEKEAHTVGERLRQLTGEAFDKAYMDAQVRMHEKVLRLVEDVLMPAVNDEDLEIELRSTQAAAASHLERARRILGELGTGERQRSGPLMR